MICLSRWKEARYCYAIPLVCTFVGMSKDGLLLDPGVSMLLLSYSFDLQISQCDHDMKKVELGWKNQCKVLSLGYFLILVLFEYDFGAI